jgi:hypothetical protein
MPDKEILENIRSKMATMPSDSANEIALLLLFVEYAALMHPFNKLPIEKKKKADIIERKIMQVINDLPSDGRQNLSAIIRGVQMIKHMSEV